MCGMATLAIVVSRIWISDAAMMPTISSGVIAHCATADSSSSAGRISTSLLNIDPLAMRQMIGSSRFG